ncbi:MAG: CaiB/BaiF CoA transferase family protein [Actinomycetota bacterium]
MSDATAGPLAGIRVLEVGHILAGPYAGMLLADLGADVIKIESVEGDLSRQVSAHTIDDHSTYFASVNRNKRSVHIDLSTDEGQAQLGTLAATAHALVVNLRPSGIRKLGLDYASLSRFNPKIVCVAITGYGLDGPGADWTAFDYIVQATSGIAAMTGEPDGPPSLAGYAAVDNSTGIMAALGLVAKVLEGKGGQVDVSLFEVMLSQLNYRAAAYLNTGAVPERLPLGAHSFYVPAQLFATADGYLALFVTHDEFWRRLCEGMGAPEWADDPRFVTMEARVAHRDEVIATLTARFLEASAAEWVDRLRPLGIPIGPVQDIGEALDSAVARERSTIVSVDTPAGPLRLVGNPIRCEGATITHRVPPRLHEHTTDLFPDPPEMRI